MKVTRSMIRTQQTVSQRTETAAVANIESGGGHEKEDTNGEEAVRQLAANEDARLGRFEEDMCLELGYDHGN